MSAPFKKKHRIFKRLGKLPQIKKKDNLQPTIHRDFTVSWRNSETNKWWRTDIAYVSVVAIEHFTKASRKRFERSLKRLNDRNKQLKICFT